MTNKKKLAITAVVVLVLVVAVVAVNKTLMKSPASTPTTTNNVDPNKPVFVSGDVTSATVDKINFLYQGVEKSAAFTGSTQLVKQIQVSGNVNIVSAKIVDFKKGTQIVVFYSSVDGNTYNATKIQIIK